MLPLIVALAVFTHFVGGDYNSHKLGILSSLALLPISKDLPSAFMLGWSNQVDLIACLCLCVTLNLFKKINKEKSVCFALLAAGVSIIPRLVRFMSDPLRLSYLRLARLSSVSGRYN